MRDYATFGDWLTDSIEPSRDDDMQFAWEIVSDAVRYMGDLLDVGYDPVDVARGCATDFFTTLATPIETIVAYIGYVLEGDVIDMASSSDGFCVPSSAAMAAIARDAVRDGCITLDDVNDFSGTLGTQRTLTSESIISRARHLAFSEGTHCDAVPYGTDDDGNDMGIAWWDGVLSGTDAVAEYSVALYAVSMKLCHGRTKRRGYQVVDA